MSGMDRIKAALKSEWNFGVFAVRRGAMPIRQKQIVSGRSSIGREKRHGYMAVRTDVLDAEAIYLGATVSEAIAEIEAFAARREAEGDE